jgi:hypothetical protein
LESILGLLKSLKIPAQDVWHADRALGIVAESILVCWIRKKTLFENHN